MQVSPVSDAKVRTLQRSGAAFRRGLQAALDDVGLKPAAARSPETHEANR